MVKGTFMQVAEVSLSSRWKPSWLAVHCRNPKVEKNKLRENVHIFVAKDSCGPKAELRKPTLKASAFLFSFQAPGGPD